MTVDERRRPAMGRPGPALASRARPHARGGRRADGLNLGYLSQIENDKASPSLSCLAALGDALDVPITWFFMGEVPPPHVVRASDRLVEDRDGLGRIERVDGGEGRDVSIVEGIAPVGGRAACHAQTSCFRVDGACRRASTSWRSGRVVPAGTGPIPHERRGDRRRGGAHPDRHDAVARLELAQSGPVQLANYAGAQEGRCRHRDRARVERSFAPRACRPTAAEASRRAFARVRRARRRRTPDGLSPERTPGSRSP